MYRIEYAIRGNEIQKRLELGLDRLKSVRIVPDRVDAHDLFGKHSVENRKGSAIDQSDDQGSFDQPLRCFQLGLD